MTQDELMQWQVKSIIKMPPDERYEILQAIEELYKRLDRIETIDAAIADLNTGVEATVMPVRVANNGEVIICDDSPSLKYYAEQFYWKVQWIFKSLWCKIKNNADE